MCLYIVSRKTRMSHDIIRPSCRGRRADADRIRIQGVDDALLQEAARKTEGFSGRELAKLMASAQAAAYGSTDGVLTGDMFTRVCCWMECGDSASGHRIMTHHPRNYSQVVDTKIREHKQRRAFEEGLHTSS